jgi:ribosomal protein S12 methylthiotransferase
MRGDLASRPAGDVLMEAETLVTAGVKELLIISQDTSAYGVDVKYAASAWRGQHINTQLYDLAEALSTLGVWVRLHYVYPYPHVDTLMPLMASGAILPYLDIPFQHASPNVLKAMRRPANQEKTAERIRAWRKAVPNLTLRSTFIVGFPGETEEDFEFLLEWLKEVELDRVGCFKYEDVKGATANALGNHVPQEVKEERWHRFMQASAEISQSKLQRKVGTQQRAIVDEIKDGKLICRTEADAPEIDGLAYAPRERGVRVGDFVTLEISAADHYDLFGTVIK